MAGAIFLGFILIIVLIFPVMYVIDYLAPEKRAVRAEKKRNTKELDTTKRKLTIATVTLTKIGAGTSGNPVLDAQNALEDISNLLIKELEQ